MHRGRKYSGIKKPITRAIGASLVTAEVQPDLSPHDKKELARFVRKYGRRAIVHAAQTIPLPEKRGRRLRGPEFYEKAENIAECIIVWTEEHRTAGSKTPVEDALRDLYDVMVDQKTQDVKGHFARWKRTIQRRRNDVHLHCLW
jgi:hypothetical protein